MIKQSSIIVDECRVLLNKAIVSSPDLFGGNLGLAIYHAWMTHKGNDDSHQEKSITYLDNSIKGFQDQKIYNGSLAHGLAGLGFTLGFLDDMEIVKYPQLSHETLVRRSQSSPPSSPQLVRETLVRRSQSFTFHN